ncbi:hypothetical protein [Haloactinomyces albus]|uniref:Uncharacterized protein n=1 Tax=Haloactinomyces albus TaxID=1352928 RepID=A0AAE4CP71_9ACTN|nr:hypothetical protein [Haloactinomyces albus]MDR7304584.1 hypothetical protein [Haloactinomyces albus]
MALNEIALYQAQRSLLLDAAAVLRRRYVRGVGRGDGLPAAAAEGLSNFLEGIARSEPALHNADLNEAIALAHRLIDDDHPEHSRLWPA